MAGRLCTRVLLHNAVCKIKREYRRLNGCGDGGGGAVVAAVTTTALPAAFESTTFRHFLTVDSHSSPCAHRSCTRRIYNNKTSYANAYEKRARQIIRYLKTSITIDNRITMIISRVHDLYAIDHCGVTLYIIIRYIYYVYYNIYVCVPNC